MQPVIEPAAVADLAQLEPRLGEWLLAEHKLSPADLERALGVQRTMGGRLGQLLVDLGLVSEADVGAAYAHLSGLPLVRRDDFPKEKPVTARLNASFLLANYLLPLGDADGDAMPTFAASDPGNRGLRDALRLVFGQAPRIVFGLHSEIADQLDEWFVREGEGEGEAQASGEYEATEFIEHLRDMASEAPIIQRVNQILSQAVSAQASDIHIETYEDKSAVRIRVEIGRAHV